MSIYIQLTPDECERIKRECIRAIDEMNGMKNIKGFTHGDKIDRALTGAYGEYALSKYLGTEWRGYDFSLRKNPDVSGFEVKSTHLKNGCLLFASDSRYPRYNNDPSRVYIFCRTNALPMVEIVGYQIGYKIIQKGRYLTTDNHSHMTRNCYALPAKDLEPIEKLI
jgi:hypothetical protein